MAETRRNGLEEFAAIRAPRPERRHGAATGLPAVNSLDRIALSFRSQPMDSPRDVTTVIEK
jgi:hypothetical protein